MSVVFVGVIFKCWFRGMWYLILSGLFNVLDISFLTRKHGLIRGSFHWVVVKISKFIHRSVKNIFVCGAYWGPGTVLDGNR